MKLRVGNGFDVHRLVAGRPLRLGGVEILPSEQYNFHRVTFSER